MSDLISRSALIRDIKSRGYIDAALAEIFESIIDDQPVAEGLEEQEAIKRVHYVHYLKLAAAYYDDVAAGVKTFELRKNDRDYKTGDILEMDEFKDGRNTGRVIRCRVTYMLEGYTGLADGYCILGIKVLGGLEHERDFIQGKTDR